MNGSLLVLGGAVSGVAAARLGLRLGYDVAVYDLDPAVIDQLDVDVRTHAGAWQSEWLNGADLVVSSPGIPPHAPPVVDALSGSAPVVSELEFGSAHLEAPYVAVTGTNGKTTVAESTADMMIADGLRACAAGNVGLAVSDIALDPWDAVAIEASSFQLQLIDRFHPRAAAILNIAPDHLDWHGGFEPYVAAKLRITENQTSDDILAFDPADEVVADATISTAARRVPVSGGRRPVDGNGPDDGSLWIGDHAYPVPKLDPVWLYDLTVAATLSSAVGVGPLGIQTVFERFEPGPHRRQIAGVANGVTWINDSKATNPHAAMASICAYDSVVLIAGGRNKDLDLGPMLTMPNLRHVFAVGESAVEMEAVGGNLVTIVADLADAVDKSAEIAGPGDTVLLAPGCASFDMFSSYAERGREFTELVEQKLGSGDE